ncbi:MAG: hypothetical protein LBS59_06050 [Puniceicoccales bacterium]|jgi:hypothetical protein|nr:hypothetical protein [Puniceicoccales bacterium]
MTRFSFNTLFPSNKCRLQFPSVKRRQPLLLLAIFPVLAVLLPATASAQDQFDIGRRAPRPTKDKDTVAAAAAAAVKGLPSSPILGKIVWVDASGRHAVAWLNRLPFPAETNVSGENAAAATPALAKNRPLATRGADMAPLALLYPVGDHTSRDRALGLVVQRGTVRKGQELVLPAASFLEKLNTLPLRPESSPPPPKSTTKALPKAQ